jgi:hypothetical protein
MPALLVSDALVQKQLQNFGLTDESKVTSAKSVERFLEKTGIALRYWRTERLPMASLYQAVSGNPEPPPKEKNALGTGLRESVIRMAIELTNHLLEGHHGIEVNVIGNRIVLVHRDLAPSLYVLVRNHRPPVDLTGVSLLAKKVFHFIMESKETTAGQVRKFLGMPAVDLNNDPAYKTLAELQRNLLVDRGPFQMRKTGIPYLSKEGHPYHCFHLAHEELVTVSLKLSRNEAALNFIYGYLKGAVFATDKKMAGLFASVLSSKEISDALGSLVKLGKVSMEIVKKHKVVIVK